MLESNHIYFIISNIVLHLNFQEDSCILAGTTKASGGLAGGDELSYSFIWLESINGTVWNLATQTRTNADYQAEALIAPKYYKRYVLSGGCKDTSAMVKVDTTHLPGGVFSRGASRCGGSFRSSPGPEKTAGEHLRHGYSPRRYHDEDSGHINSVEAVSQLRRDRLARCAKPGD